MQNFNSLNVFVTESVKEKKMSENQENIKRIKESDTFSYHKIQASAMFNTKRIKLVFSLNKNKTF